MKMNGKGKKLLIGLIGFCMAIVIFAAEVMTNITDVQAETMVFGKITDTYKNKDEFTILEIEPSDATYTFSVQDSGSNTGNASYTVSDKSELGYLFSAKPTSRFYKFRNRIISGGFGKTSLGARYGDPNIKYEGSWDSAKSKEYANLIYVMRSYGLIKPDGPDTEGYSTKIGEYPFYSTGGAVFSSYKGQYTPYQYDTSFEKGTYSLAPNNDGDYNLADGYTIDNEGRICKVEEQTVSKNGIPEGATPIDPPDISTVSDNDLVKVQVLTPVTVREKLELPAESDSLAYVTQANPKGTGNLSFARDWDESTDKVTYWGYSDRALFYGLDGTGDQGFFNSDWFQEYVFGSNSKYHSLNIQYNTKAANNVTEDDINSADLIYINGTYEEFVNAKQDLSAGVITHLYNKVIIDHKALMMDYAGYSSTLGNNISKLAMLLWQEQSVVSKLATEKKYYSGETKLFSKLDEFADDKEVREKLLPTVKSGGNGNFVVGNTYVYNHHLSDFSSPKSLVDAFDNFANGDFNTPYTSTVASTGFSDVLNYITATNKNSMDTTMPLSVTPAVAIQYILVSDGTPLSIVKTTLRVLEIEPTTAFLFNERSGSEEYGELEENGTEQTNRDSFIEQCLSSYYSGDIAKKFISFESMSIDEFNGHNEDLIENYDIIYIGSEMGGSYYTDELNTLVAETGIYKAGKTEKKKLPVYTDTRMNGMVYYNIGDQVSYKSERLNGIIDSGADKNHGRYQGRDLTKTKLKKLKKFVEANSLVVVAGDLMAESGTSGNVVINPTQLNSSDNATDDHGRVDNASNLYEFLMYARGYLYNSDTGAYENKSTEGAYEVKKNVVSRSMFTSGYVKIDDVSTYVATEKLALVLSEKPREYNYDRLANSQVIDPASVQYLEQNADGSRTLTYKFTITADETVAEQASTYKPHLYIDINNDGKYSSETEDIKDFTVADAATGTEAQKDEKNLYILNKNVEYILTRAVSEEYCGLIKWKLDIQSRTYDNSHASEEGYTLAANITKKDKECKILQITQNGSASTLNLQKQLASKDSLYGKYLNSIPGYTVEIRTITVDEFKKLFKDAYDTYKNGNGTKSVKEYALEFFANIEIVSEETKKGEDGTDVITQQAVKGANMLVLGFGDNYPTLMAGGTSPDNSALLAVEAFMESGQPVLLTHDFVMFYPDSAQAQSLRNLVGMDKYGVTQDIVTESNGNKIQVKELVSKLDAVTGAKTYLHDGIGCTSSKTDKEKKSIIESTGKAVAYQPGLGRATILGLTQGVSNSTLARFANDWNTQKMWNANEKANNRNSSTEDNGKSNYTVNKLNDGQLTVYPYILPDSFKVATTHSQYFELDLDEDSDSDGESDVVVWYTLGESGMAPKDNGNVFDPYAEDVGGCIPSDGYYIYNKGNITYTGAGHSDMTKGSEEEVQLFVNTLMAAFSVNYTKPAVGFFESAKVNAPEIKSVAIPYDKNVVENSSVVKKTDTTYKYQFVDPNTNASINASEIGTPIFFRLTDANFVRGSKFLTIRYYLRADGKKSGEKFTVEDGSAKGRELEVTTINVDNIDVPVVDISNLIVTYDVENEALKNTLPRETDGSVTNMESAKTYGFYLPLSYLNKTGAFSIYMEAQTTIQTVSATTNEVTSSEVVPTKAYQELTVTKTDLLDLD